MNFNRKSYLAALSLLAITGVFTGCEEESNVAKAVMASANSLSFPGEDVSEQLITVYSDAEWTADVPEWVSIEPTTGSGTTDVTVTVNANMREGALDKPRTAELVFHGNTDMSRAVVLVKQEGNKFRDVQGISVSDAVKAEDKSVVIVNDAQVVALSTESFIISDGKANILVPVAKELEIGAHVAVWGNKSTENGIPAFSICDKIEVKSAGAIEYPEAKDITESAETYTSEAIEFLTVKGVLRGELVSIENSAVSISVQNPIKALNLDKLNRHYVTVKGYYVGTAKPYHNMIVTEVEDRGKKFEMNEGFPIEWVVGVKEDPNVYSFEKTGKIVSTTGSGILSYVQSPENAIMNKDLFHYKVGGTGEPFVECAWPGDYWEFKSDSPISKGTTIGVEFSVRSSQGGLKYWILEYQDGDEWKPLGETKKINYNGAQVDYTHAMIKGGKENLQIRTKYTVKNDTENACVRLRVVSNITVKDGVKKEPDGSTNRLSHRQSDDVDCNPKLSIL